MKLNYKSFFTACVLMVVAANANAGLVADWYAGANISFGGNSLFSKDTTNSQSSKSYGALVGVDLPVVRFEAEYNYIDSDKLDMSLAMGNAYVKLPLFPVVDPYIGVGVGLMINAKTMYHENISANVAYQGMLGATLNIPVLPFKVDVEGRALIVPGIYSVNDERFNAVEYDARLKLRYIF